MNLSWKFWRRKPPVLPAVPVQQYPVQWLPLSSSRELLGLQRIVGNQAVLQLLASRKNLAASDAAAAKKPHQSFWHKLRRD